MLVDLGITARASRPTPSSVGNAAILKALIHLLPVQWAHDPDQAPLCPSYPALTADGALIIGAINGALVAIGP